MRPGPRKLLLTLTGVAGASMIVALAVQKNAAVEDYHRSLWERSVPHVGIYLPELDLATQTGDTTRVGAPRDKPTQLLYYFTTSCPYCEASVPTWSRLHQQLRGHVEVIGLSLSPADSTKHYIDAHQLEFPVVRLPDGSDRYRSLLRTSQVPATIVVNGLGRVIYARVGVVDSRIVADSIRESALVSTNGRL